MAYRVSRNLRFGRATADGMGELSGFGVVVDMQGTLGRGRGRHLRDLSGDRRRA